MRAQPFVYVCSKPNLKTSRIMCRFQFDQIENAVVKAERVAIQFQVIRGRTLTRSNVALEQAEIVERNVCDCLSVVIRAALFECLDAKAVEKFENALFPIADRLGSFDH